MKVIFKNLFLSLILAVMMTSCNSGNSNRTISELITCFDDNGFEGETSEMAFTLIGAIDGVAYSGDNFSIEVYKFKDSKNISEMLPYKNGNFGMLVHEPSEDKRTDLIKTFNSFK